MAGSGIRNILRYQRDIGGKGSILGPFQVVLVDRGSGLIEEAEAFLDVCELVDFSTHLDDDGDLCFFP